MLVSTQPIIQSQGTLASYRLKTGRNFEITCEQSAAGDKPIYADRTGARPRFVLFQILPNRVSVSALSPLGSVGLRLMRDLAEGLWSEFDYRYKIGLANPSMMNVITHGYLSSRVPAIDTFEQIIKYAKSHNDVWFARRGDIAAWARKC